MGIYLVGTWLALLVVGQEWGGPAHLMALRLAHAWPALLGAVYLPMLYVCFGAETRLRHIQAVLRPDFPVDTECPNGSVIDMAGPSAVKAEWR